MYRGVYPRLAVGGLWVGLARVDGVLWLIEGIVGTVGAGKSLCAVLRMKDAAEGGRACYSNLFPRDHNYWKWADWDGMKEAGEGLFVVDEAQVWFNSRTFKENTSELAAWQQSRKRGADLVWVAQHENRVDTAIRELTSLLWRPRIVGPFLFVTAEDVDSGDRRAFRYWHKRQGFNLYHTDQIIGGRADPPTLARVVPLREKEATLYVQAPTHAVVDDLKGSRLVPYHPKYRDSHAVLLYREYNGEYLEIDPSDMRVLGRLYERCGARYDVMRMVKEAIREVASRTSPDQA